MTAQNISPADLLGVVLTIATKRRKAVFEGPDGKPVESAEELPVLSIDSREDGVICAFPLSELVDYQAKKHALQFEVLGKPGMENLAVITLEEPSNVAVLLSMSGQPARSQDSLMSKFIAELSGLNLDEPNKIQNT